MIASISIFCRKRTTGASSTSVATSARLRAGCVTSSVTSNSKSPDDERLERFVGAGALVVEQLGELVVLDDHPLGRELGRELDALDGFLVGRVGAADEEAVAALAEHDDLVLGRELVVDDVARQPLVASTADQVEQRQRQRGRQRVRELGRRHRAGGDDRGDEAGALFLARLRTSSSAAFAFSLPAWTSTRATPERADCGASASVSNSGDARSMMRKADDHRRFTRGCKRCGQRAAATIHAASAKPPRQVHARSGMRAGRGERIRTSGLYVPNVALYQAKLHPAFRPPATDPPAARQRSDASVRTNDRPIERTILAERRGTACSAAASSAGARLVGLGARGVARRLDRAGARARCRRSRPAARPRRARSRGGSIARSSGVPRSIAISSGSVGLPSRRSSPTFLPSCVGRAFVVEQVVDQLERGAERPAVVGAGFLDRGVGARRARRRGARSPRTASRS